MKVLKSFYHFLGGIYFAIILITMTAFLVILGTFLEAYTDSHLYAVQGLYEHSLFVGLLWLFFINILFSALRRWPFRLRHIPFLITHLGLLMIIGGTILKNRYGLQGNLSLIEGSGSRQVYLPQTFALHVEKRDRENVLQNVYATYGLNLKQSHVNENALFPDLKFRVLGFSPHVSEKLETWIKGDQAWIAGFLPFAVQEWKPNDPLIIAGQVKFPTNETSTWDLIALKTEYSQEAIQEAYIQGTNATVTSKRDPSVRQSVILRDLLKNPSPFSSVQLDLTYHPRIGFNTSALKFVCKNTNSPEKISIPLKGSQALLPRLESRSLMSTPSWMIDLKRRPTLLILTDSKNGCALIAFDPYGRVHVQSFHPADLETLIVYDGGFGGYAAQFTLPFPQFPAARDDLEAADQFQLSQALQSVLKNDPNLSPPLALLKRSCDQTQADFVETFVSFLKSWQDHYHLLFPSKAPLESSLERVFQHLDWTSIPLNESQACQWTSLLASRLEEALELGEDPVDFLRKNHWPFAPVKTEEDREFFTHLIQQVFAISASLPQLGFQHDLSPSENAHLFSAYLQAYGINDDLLRIKKEGDKEDYTALQNYWKSKGYPLKEAIVFETPLTLKHQVEKPLIKLEDNRPAILLEVRSGSQKQVVSIGYDALGTGLKWPILDGKYTIRFQPRVVEIPYRIRLREARQINYPNSSQPYSYESDIIVLNNDQEPVEKTLSMNRVHETWDGYRFYLAGMSAQSESSAKTVQIVVNHDPAKYLLTYPGAILISLGIILLFWMWPYSKKKGY